MASELARHAHGLQVPDDDCAINAPRGEEVALAVEANACRVAGPDGVGDIFGVVLEEVIVGEEKIHFGVGCAENCLDVGRGRDEAE